MRAIAIDGTPPERRRMWELVAHGMASVPSTTRRLIGTVRGRGFCFFGAHVAKQADPLAVRALAEVIRDMEPG